MASRKHRVLQQLEYAIFRLFRVLLRAMGAGATRRLGAFLGSLAYRAGGSRAELTRKNLAASFPDRDAAWVKGTARGCWIHFAIQLLQYVRELDAPLEKMLESAEIVGAEPVREATAQGRGVVLYTAHFGNWETAVALLSELGTRFAVVARPLDNKLLQEEIERGRRRAGVEVFPRRRAAARMRDWIEGGGGITVLPDQAVKPSEGILADFVGRPAWTTTAPARLAIRSGAIFVGAFCYADERGKVRAILTTPVDTRGMETEPEQLRILTEQMNSEISRVIRDHPELWLWMHDRWKGAESARP